MTSFFYALPNWLRRHRIWILSAYALLAVICFIGTGKVWRDDSIEAWLGKDSAVFKNQQQFERYFGSNEDLYLVVEAKDGDIFSEKSLAALAKLNDKLASYTVEIQRKPDSPLKHILEVISLVNVSVTDVEGDNLSSHPFIGSKLPKDKAGREALKHKAIADPELVKRYISKDGKFAAISLKTDFGSLVSAEKESANSDAAKDISLAELHAPAKKVESTLKKPPIDYEEYGQFMTEIRQFVSDAGVDHAFAVHYAGLPELIAFTLTINDENAVIFAGLFLLMFITLVIIFRHPSAVVWCLSLILLTLLFTNGAIGWSGAPTSDLTAAMWLMLIIISVADAVHIFAGYKYEREEGYGHEEAMSLTLSKVGISCLLTLLTNVVGFISIFIVQPNIPSANFGFFTALGLAAAYLMTTTLLPILMDFWHPPFKGLVDHHSEGGKHDKRYPIMDKLSSIASGYPKAVIFGVMLALVPAGAGLFQLKVDSNALESFEKSSYIRKAFEIADQHMAGTQNIDFMINLEQADAIYDAEVLKKIDQLQQRMLKEFPDLISTSVSVVNVLKRINQQLHKNDPAYYRLPDSNGEISQLLFLFNNISPAERRRLVSEDFDATRISFGLRNAGSTEYIRLVDSAKLWGDEYFSGLKGKYANLKVVTSGGVIFFMTLFDNIARSELLCFIITLSVVTFTLFFIFSSIRIGVIALIPNLVPVIVTFGAMGWLGIALNNVNMIIAPIILGIAVDDTVHFLHKLKSVLVTSRDVSEAIKMTFRESGTALVSTTMILTAGMLMLLYSSNADLKCFGYLSALAFFSGLLAELTLTPALCRLFLSKETAVSTDGLLTLEGNLK